MSIYCISVRGGMEESYCRRMQELLGTPKGLFCGTTYFLRKRMRLKTGKEYLEPFFPGYVFLETEESDAGKLRATASCNGFLRFLPSNSAIMPLVKGDLDIVNSILRYGSTIDIVPVTFDEGDRIVILDGPFKDSPGKIVAVNRRNKRVNIQLDFLNGLRVIGLTYQEVKKL